MRRAEPGVFGYAPLRCIARSSPLEEGTTAGRRDQFRDIARRDGRSLSCALVPSDIITAQ
jgi:hypothetical protein